MQRFIKKSLFFGIFLVMSIGLQVGAQAQTTDYKFHSVFIYNFTKYIQWPAEQQAGDFVIGVLGNSSISEDLEKMAMNKTVGTQKIVVKKFKSAAEAGTCHILFIPNNSNVSFDDIQHKFKGKPTLLITEKTGLAQKGSGINFVLQDNKWKFELNEAATQSAGLKVSKELSKLAITV
ncbi:YfiR family protein [Rhodocytophaga aerolata]|uniref:YfiR family protein n=1 Tax=Rhodocytophaga aerolata TaxID=455078 RepID=A0ABT8R7M4_9BACT|nr:YfiR family protein [Rhodocytophaga aerolata]MDO1447248.1 YfiR family protein [Rhodocytophaga aerolata]